jgi:DNA-binding MarR family transcriptional regulator
MPVTPALSVAESPLPAAAAAVATLPEDPVAAQAAHALRQFRVVFNAVRSHFQQVEKIAGIGGAQVWALSVVQSHPGISVSRLAEAMDIHQSTASNLVRQLIKRELLRTEKSPRDRRSVVLQLLPAGQALLQSVPGPHQGVLPQALQRMPQASLTGLNQHLGELVRLLRADPNAAGIPLAEL